jgi:hypothetical protein
MATTAPKPETRPTAKVGRILCSLHMHKREFRSADGDPYRKCLDCGRFVDITPKMGL